MEGVLVGSFLKNRINAVRVHLTEYDGHRLVDIRTCWEAELGDGQWLPTRKGVTFRRALIPDLIAILETALDADREGADRP